MGMKLAQTEDLNLGVIYKGISDSLLDGMPCDHAIRVLSEANDEIVWTRMSCVHEPYWNEVGADIADYYTLREAWLEGLAKAVGIKFEKVDDKTYAIKLA